MKRAQLVSKKVIVSLTDMDNQVVEVCEHLYYVIKDFIENTIVSLTHTCMLYVRESSTCLKIGSYEIIKLDHVINEITKVINQ